MKLYIAGPMTGLPDLNFPTFHAATEALRAAGHTVANPAEINPDHSTPWAVCMQRDIAELVTCEGIVMLPGWEKSDGATIERLFARRMGLHIFSADTLHEVPACE